MIGKMSNALLDRVEYNIQVSNSQIDHAQGQSEIVQHEFQCKIRKST